MAGHEPGGIALVFARTETRLFFEAVYPHFSAMLFLRGRLQFYRPTGTVGDCAAAPSVLIGYGPMAEERLGRCGLDGFIIHRRQTQVEVEHGQGRLL